ncbi:MAG: CRISPR-associated endonuclease Cas3'', partial [Planctomycetes bacterium]|nr:CRISPR-associated endonuclease Cas3'' [Planctomycetota bacterium]
MYAKSRPSNLPESAKAPSSLFLPGHLQDVYHAALRVFDCTADEQLQALGLLADEQQMARFRRILLLAAAVHDLGKANDHFQGLLQKTPERRGRKQGLRHEWMTLMMLDLDARYELRSWLLPAVENDEHDWRVVLWAVSGHHPAHDRPSPPLSAEQGAGNTARIDR